MSNRQSWLGDLFVSDREAARAHLVMLMRRYKGNMKAVAFELGFDRRYIFRVLWRESLWHVLDEIRAQHPRPTRREDPDWLMKARRALKGDRGGLQAERA